MGIPLWGFPYGDFPIGIPLVGSKCFLIPELLVWTLVWVSGVGCWRGISKLRRGDHHPCEVLHFNQCSDLQEVELSPLFFVLSLWTAVGVGVGVGCWCGVLVWVVGVGCWRGISKLRRGDHHPRGILHCNQCSGVGCWRGLLAWESEVVAWGFAVSVF